MLATLVALIITYSFLWLLPFWLVWPAGVLFSLYVVTLIEEQKGATIEDRKILGVLVGSWLTVCYGVVFFFIH